MKKKHIPNTILRSSPTAVHRSGVTGVCGSELVIIFDYLSTTGEVGYFVTWEKTTTNGLYDYSSVERFFKRVDDRAFQEALALVASLASTLS